jgi:hypothetical protein
VALVLAVLVRKRHPSFGWTLAGASLLAVALVVWATVVQPVNVQVANAIRNEPASVPTLWMQLRFRWEGGHAAGFVLQVVGFACLLGSVLVETPPDDEPRATPVVAW